MIVTIYVRQRISQVAAHRKAASMTAQSAFEILYSQRCIDKINKLTLGNVMKKYAGESLGTFWLVFGGLLTLPKKPKHSHI